MWSGPCQQLALATVLDAPHGPRPTHEHVRKTSPVTCCASAVTDTSSTCALWGSAIAHRVRCAGQNSRTAGRGGPPSHVGLGRSLGRGMGIYPSIAVCSSQYPSSCRVATRAAVGGRRRVAVGHIGVTTISLVFHTQEVRVPSHTEVRTNWSEPQPATAHRLPALVGTLSSAKSEELRARAITNLPKSSEHRRAGMWERVGRPVPVF